MDLASAHVLAVEALLKRRRARRLQSWQWHGTSIGQIMDCFKRLGLNVPHHFKPRRAGDPIRLIADTRAVRQQLKWKPHYADIETIIGSAYHWHLLNVEKAEAHTPLLEKSGIN